MEERVYWFTDSEENKRYSQTTWYRCPKIEEFINLVEKKNKIVAFVVHGNNIGFILDEKEE